MHGTSTLNGCGEITVTIGAVILLRKYVINLLYFDLIPSDKFGFFIETPIVNEETC